MKNTVFKFINHKIIFVTLFLFLNSCLKFRTTLPAKEVAPTDTTSTTTTTTEVEKASLSFKEGATTDLGTILVGLSVEKTLTVTNSGSASATSLSTKVTSPFAFKGGTYPGTDGTCTTTLAKSASCTIVVTFTSSTVTSSTSTFTLTYNDGSSSQTTSISLVGIASKLSQKQKMVGTGTNGRIAGDQFGFAVSLYDDTLAVGASYHDYDENGANNAGDAGAVFVYLRTGSTWALQQKLVGQGTNGRLAGDEFGYSVSLYKNTVAIGAYIQTYDQNGANNLASAGAVYIFTRSGSTWSFQQKIVGQGTNGRLANDYFGESVSLYEDTVVIGTSFQDYDENGANFVSNAGAAYVFVRSGTTWTFQQKLVGQGTNARIATSRFGFAVSLYGDTAAIGAYGNGYDENGANVLAGAGSAFVFIRSGTTWTLQQKLVGQGTNGRVAGDGFGYGVSLYKDSLAITAYGQSYDENGANSVFNAGAAYVFTRSGTTWSLQQKIVGQGTNGRVANDQFGTAVTLFGDVLAVAAYQQGYDEDGANFLADAGAVFLYTRSGTTWSFLQKIVGKGTNGRIAADCFGCSDQTNAISLYDSTFASSALGQDYDENGANSLANAGAAYVWGL